MAVPITTIGQLKGHLSFILTRNATPETAFSAEMGWGLDYALGEFLTETRGAFLHADSSFTTVYGQADYGDGYLKDDIHAIIDKSVKFGAADFRTLTYMVAQHFDQWEGSRVQTTGEPNIYMLKKRDQNSGVLVMTLHPTPVSARVVNYRYIALPPEIAAASDGTQLDQRIPVEFRQALVFGAATCFPQFLNREEIGLYLDKWNKAIRRARGQAQAVLGIAYQRERYDTTMFPSRFNRQSLVVPTGTYV